MSRATRMRQQAAERPPEAAPTTEAVVADVPAARKPRGVRCPECGQIANEVARTHKRIGSIRRSRLCDCGATFSTIETLERADMTPPKQSSADVATNLKKALTAFGVALETFPPLNGE